MILPERLKINSNSSPCHKIWSKETRTELEINSKPTRNDSKYIKYFLLHIRYYILYVIYYRSTLIYHIQY